MSDAENVKGKNISLIINPKAGHLISQQRGNRIAELLQKHSCNVRLFYTERRGHAMQIVADNAKKTDIFICCGGDGTLNETVNGVMEHAPNTPIGYIPSGTTNDFASTMKLSKNLDRAVSVITSGCLFQTDIGRIKESGRYFSYIASFGAFTSVSYQTPQETKNVFGHAAYIFDGIKSLKDIKGHRVTVYTDDGVIDGDFVFGSITNSMSVGGVMSFKKNDVCLDDGKLEVLLISMPENPQQLSDIMFQLLNQKHDGKTVRLMHSSHIRMVFDAPTSFTADGEFAGEYVDISVDNVQKALKIYTPEKKHD